LLTAAVLGALATALHRGMSEAQAVTVSFLTLAYAQLWHVFAMRDAASSLLRNDVVRNPWVWGALALCVTLLLAATHLPGLADVLALQPIGLPGWLWVLGFSLAPITAVELWRPARAGLAAVRRAFRPPSQR
jgi:Ca2+-transporting ATPase